MTEPESWGGARRCGGGVLLAFGLSVVLGAACAGSARASEAQAHPDRWPVIHPGRKDGARLERRVNRLLAAMTLRQKVGQLIQADITGIRPRDLLRWPLGSILSGGNSKPGGSVTAAPRHRPFPGGAVRAVEATHPARYPRGHRRGVSALPVWGAVVSSSMFHRIRGTQPAPDRAGA